MRLPITMLLISMAAAVTAQASTVSIATFVDPTIGDPLPTPMFLYDAGAQELTAVWADAGLTLETIAGTYDDVTFSMTAVAGGLSGSLGAGQIDFLASNNDLLLSIVFDSAQLNVTSFGATEFLATNEVQFSGSILTLPVEDESFAFAFGNQAAVGDDGSFTATAAFTSSAVIIPEPVSLALMGVGGMVILRKTRHSKHER